MRTVIKLLAAAALFAPGVALAQSAAQSAERRFTHEGVTHVYTVITDAKGRQVIEGHSQPGGSRFRYVIKGDWVQGVAGGQPVAFRTPRGGSIAVAAR